MSFSACFQDSLAILVHMNSKDKVLVTVGTVAVLGVASFTGYALFATKNTDTSAQVAAQTTSTPSSSATTTTTATPTSTSTASGSAYKDGQYSTTINYGVPHGGSNSITVNLTVKDGVVTAVTTDNSYQDGESGMYIDSFKSGLNGAVVGKSLGDLSVSYVGGASLTSFAFNDALDTIRSDAKA